MKIVSKIIVKILNVFSVVWILLTMYAQFSNILDYVEYEPYLVAYEIVAMLLVLLAGVTTLGFMFYNLFKKEVK